jgi:hypothetical protein
MQSKKINELGTNVSPSVNDLTVVGDATTGQLKKITLNQIASLFGSVGGVSSVSMTVPTGLTVTGSPITTSGTLAVTLTAGYSIPTTVKQSEWDLGYSERLKWDGGASGLSAPTARTSLGLVIGTDVLAYRTFGSAANNNTADFATAAQGVNADTAYTNRITGASLPLSISGNIISIAEASTTISGFLSSTNFNIFNGKQAALNGTGFVKATGTTISYDNTSYLPLGGGTMSGPLTIAGTGTTQFIDGTGDGATFSVYNSALSGWFGLAFYNPTAGGDFPNTVSGVLNFRNGTINMKGGFIGGTFNGTSATFSSSVTATTALFNGSAVSILADGIKINRDPSTTSSAIFNAYDGSTNIISNSGITSSFLGIRFLVSDNTTTNVVAVITGTGNVGIGTSSPTAKLEVVGQTNFTNGAINLGGTATAGSTDPAIYRVAGNDMVIAIGSTERMRITNGGSVLIGTSTDAGASNKLQVDGNIYMYYGSVFNFNGSSPINNILVRNTGSTFSIGGNTSIVGTLSATNFSGTSSGTNTGDQTLAGLGGQPQLNGTGFVKASGTTISYDNTNYLALSGGTLTGGLSGTTATFSGLVTNYNVFNRQTSSYTLVLSDASKIIEMDALGANTVTVPLDSSVAFPVGTEITVLQLGAGVTTIAFASGVTFRSNNFGTRIGDQYSGATLIKRAANDWYLIGNILP